jgi:hypothetical protein
MAKSNRKLKKQNKQNKQYATKIMINKPFTEIVEENLSQNYLEFTSKIKLFNKIYDTYYKSKKQIKFLLKNSLNKLIEKKILLQKKNSVRFTKFYFDNKNKKKKIEIKQIQQINQIRI